MLKHILISFTFFLVIFFQNFAFADLVGSIEGKTQKEREVRWLWRHLGDFINSCADSGKVRSDPEIQDILGRVTASGSQEGLQFVSEQEQPGLFTSAASEVHRVAVTELKPNSTIYINSDRINNLTSTQWAGLLTHELVHHLGIPDGSSRLPDRVGVAVASCVENNISETSLAEFGHPESNLFIFSEPEMRRPARVLANMLHFSLDVEVGPNSRVPICGSGELLIGQNVSAPIWRVTYIKNKMGRVGIRGAARMTNLCQKQDGSQYEMSTALVVRFDLNYGREFDTEGAWWELPSQIDPVSLVAGVSDGKEDQIDIHRSFAIEKIEHEKSKLSAGEVWNSKITVVSTDGFAPSQCRGFFSGTKWFYSSQMDTTMFDSFENCKVVPLGNDRWQASLSRLMPANAQPDLFSLSFLALTNGKETRFATPGKPVYVSLENSTAATPLKGRAWTVQPGLEKLEWKIGNRPLNNAYRINFNEPFGFEFYLEGKQKILDHFFDFQFIARVNGQDILMPWNPSISQLKDIVLKTEIRDIVGGTCVRYLLNLPKIASGQPVVGFKIKRISLKSDDYSWTELEFPDFTDYLFVSKGYNP